MKFIDLFSGLGGFHIALSQLGHECVFASEIKPVLIDLYEKNFGIKPYGDIRKLTAEEIPSHDILCAGFPCQPFSKAGRQKGLLDENNGNLFNEIVRILKFHKPTYFILENVQNLAKHDKEETYNYMSYVLSEELGYDVKGEVLSPHEFNIPQHRKRLFIVGSKNSLNHFSWPKKNVAVKDAFSYIDEKPLSFVPLEREKKKCLEIWQEFLDRIPADEKLPSFPIWAMEFGATYPFENVTPFAVDVETLKMFKGNFGEQLAGDSKEELYTMLPSYAKTEQVLFPTWKRHYIRSNRAFYEKHKRNLDPVVKKIKDLDVSSWQKFEWNIQGGERIVKNYIVQFRGSGIRLKRPDFFPSLVCVSTQIPIIGWQERYITKGEGARLQGMGSLKFLPDNQGTCFDALGNAVNAEIVALIAKNLLTQEMVNEKASNLIKTHQMAV